MGCYSDSDSDDGPPPDMSDEDLAKYNTWLHASPYDVDYFPPMKWDMCPLNPKEDHEVPQLANMAIDYYNQHNHTRFKMIEVVKANLQVVSGFLYFITFKAEDANNGKIETFQGRVWDKNASKKGKERFEVGECRIKPTTTTTS